MNNKSYYCYLFCSSNASEGFACADPESYNCSFHWWMLFLFLQNKNEDHMMWMACNRHGITPPPSAIRLGFGLGLIERGFLNWSEKWNKENRSPSPRGFVFFFLYVLPLFEIVPKIYSSCVSVPAVFRGSLAIVLSFILNCDEYFNWPTKYFLSLRQFNWMCSFQYAFFFSPLILLWIFCLDPAFFIEDRPN